MEDVRTIAQVGDKDFILVTDSDPLNPYGEQWVELFDDELLAEMDEFLAEERLRRYGL